MVLKDDAVIEASATHEERGLGILGLSIDTSRDFDPYSNGKRQWLLAGLISASSVRANIQFPVPRDKQQIKNMEPLFKEIEDLQNDIKNAEILYKTYLKELSDEAIILPIE